MKEAPHFEEGDIVHLRSGGPAMIVRRGDMGMYECDWFHKGIAYRTVFRGTMLRKHRGLIRPIIEWTVGISIGIFLQQCVWGHK